MSRNWLINNAEQPKSSEQPRSSGWKTAGNALSILGATMRDTSHGLRGERSSYLSDYMSQVREMEEDALKKKIDADMLGIYGEDGLPGAVEYASKNPSKYSLENVKEFALVDSAINRATGKTNTLGFSQASALASQGEIPYEGLKQMFPDKLDNIIKQQEYFEPGLTPMEKNPDFREGSGISAFLSPNVAKINDPTRRIIEEIKTQADYNTFLKQYEDQSSNFRKAGVDVKAVKEYFGVK